MRGKELFGGDGEELGRGEVEGPKEVPRPGPLCFWTLPVKVRLRLRCILDQPKAKGVGRLGGWDVTLG